MKKDYQKHLLDGIYLIVGCALLAFAITSILKPNGLITGGITGLSIILDQLTGIKYTYLYYGLTMLVLISAWLLMGKREAGKIILLSVLFPLVLICFEAANVDFIENDTILASIYYGIIAGAGCGLILKRGFSMGGTDTIAKLIHYRLFPFISISQILFGIDLAVIMSSALIYDRNVALYAILTQIIMIKAIDLVLFGFGSKNVKIEIISEKNDEIVDYILNTIKRGISTYEIKGGYTNATRQKIISVCSPRETMLIKMFIAQIDPNAFVDVLPVISVWGKGIGFESLLEDAQV
ncbi:YitT family protein [Geosporobacter ferrireducens]|uniref:Transporter n=1 Tax=Geosporobacter ferrireducens TaxID=1424294 RepID=A0A1D8GDX3_9FIRM|nr:YitT family protein [Geosporobacter ferrireducens]AOT69105.1 transporter [Geosporobacter ferrireducens]MTI56780.1 YitT family protein [Geosporobacter ferrireducens]